MAAPNEDASVLNEFTRKHLRMGIATRQDPEEIRAAVTEHVGAETAQKLMAEITKALRPGQASYSASASLVQVFFYMHLTVDVSNPDANGKGDAGGIGLGGGYSWGDVYTDDIQALYDNTRSFYFFQGSLYFTVVFFDGSSNELGSFQGAALAGGVGTGGGTWGW